MKWLKILVLIIGSIWFIPVSCTGLLAAGTQINANLDERDVARGDEIHRYFSVVVDTTGGEQPFRVISLPELQRLRAAGELHSLLMSKKSGNINSDNDYHASYRILESRDKEQVIEVVTGDDDGEILSRYRAISTDIIPLGSRMFHMGYMYQALPFAFGAALLLYGIGWLMRRKIRALV
jgi:hypothetical protein